MFPNNQFSLFLGITVVFKIMPLICVVLDCTYELEKHVSLKVLCTNFDPKNCKENLLNETFLETIRDIFNENNLIQHLEVERALLEKILELLHHLKELREIRFMTNCLLELPSTCFRGLSNLESIYIIDNKIQALPGDLLTGLNKVKIVAFITNEIKDIDDNLFSNVSDLTSLEFVDLRDNRLTSIGPWPVMRGVSKPGFMADLSINTISSFSNNIGWKFNCKEIRDKKSRLFFDINISSNNISHLSDVVEAYFGSLTNAFCILGPKSHSNVSINVDENPFSCDCKDYSINKLLRTFSNVGFMNNARCYEPLKLRKKRFYDVAPEDLICDLSNTKSCIEGCTCIFRPHGKLFIVNCTHSKYLTRLPFSIVPLKNVSKMSGLKYSLIFSMNKIPVLENREYLESTSLLDLSESQLKTISEDALQSLKDIDVLDLNSNLLETLPKTVANVNWTIKQIKLHGNPWRCDCENVWFKSWLISMQHKITNLRSIYCYSPWWLVGKVIIKVEDHEFCENPEEKQRNNVLIGSFVSAASVLILATIAFTLLKKFKVELHCYLNVHPFDKDECKGENMIYDAFVSTSYADRLFGITLVGELESRGYGVCYHEKDFIGGQTIAENICRAIIHSKRVVCYITQNFLESNYCMYEFQKALHQNILTKRRRLVVLIDENLIVDKSTLPDDVYQFLSTHTYIEIKANNNWERHLFYSLAVNKLGNQPNNN